MKTDRYKFVIWGYKNKYHTHGHIHEAFYRALQWMGRDVVWTDGESNHAAVYDHETIFISQNNAATDIPVVRGALYLIHNFIDGNAKTEERLANSNVLHFGVMLYGRNSQHFDIYWATDLLPHEIEANKAKAATINAESRVINWVGSVCKEGEHQNWSELGAFGQQAWENGVLFRTLGAGHNTISIVDNVRLIQESRFAPTIVGPWQNQVGYIPCRIFKNISYGHFGVTNSPAVNHFFGNKLLCAPARDLFDIASSTLPRLPIEATHELMDRVSRNHTYLNRIDQLLHEAEKLL